jgi:polynucleotide 5'-kinase involved in rRNA processing
LPPPTPNFLASRTNPRSRQIVGASIGQVVVYQEVSISPWRNQRSFISGRVCIVVMQRYALKLVLVGDSRVGKSQLSRAFVNKSFLVS